MVEEAPIVKFVNLIIVQAVQERASDIHVEPTEHDLRIRFRIDGVLHERMRHHGRSSPGWCPGQGHGRHRHRRAARAEGWSHQPDGRRSVVDLRVSTLPTVHGEKIVMRILDRASSVQSLASLGFLPSQLAQYEQSFRKPYGAILVTGPTGSGKTTTLYATLNLLNEETRNIVTVEDPVEYRLDNVNQVQTNPKAGLTFANALRSILRQDPDIILVGEVRDRETGVIAIEAALTGSPGADDASHQRRSIDAASSGRDGDRAVLGDVVRRLRARSTAGAASVRTMQGAVRPTRPN